MISAPIRKSEVQRPFAVVELRLYNAIQTHRVSLES
jgi:hypothetical protein